MLEPLASRPGLLCLLWKTARRVFTVQPGLISSPDIQKRDSVVAQVCCIPAGNFTLYQHVAAGLSPGHGNRRAGNAASFYSTVSDRYHDHYLRHVGKEVPVKRTPDRNSLTLLVDGILKSYNRPEAVRLCSAPAASQEEEEEFYKFLPANTADRLCQSWQSCSNHHKI